VPLPPEAAQATQVPLTREESQTAQDAQQSQRPPIVVIAGEGQITVASRDPEALSQFETLLRTLQRGRRVRIETGNYSMFLLQNADAKQLAEVINELFQRGPRGGASGDTPWRPSFRRTRLTVVADERMNALLVYGSVADRDAIEQMLDVLDSLDIPESLTTPRPKMIPVKNLPASTILEVLQTVYKTQLTARTGVRPMTIPQGLSFEMTSMMQLINAAAEAPLLTLDIDETTNSIVMRAPRQLTEEIEEFVTELDAQAKDGGKRNISLVPLKSMNSEQVQDALRMLMPGGRSRRRE
jgi:type II secretory pathway component GspD/PulD (secretin)